MSADKSYFAVPTLTGFTLVRAKVKEGREYTNQLTGQSIQRVETGGKGFEATLTTYQPVVKIVDGEPTIVRYTDLGDDTFSYPDEAPTQQADAGGPTVTTMDGLLGQDVINSLRDVLIEVMAESIPDFAEQPAEMAAVGVPRYFHVDRIQFSGRDDRAREASLKVLLGVYGDADCTELRKYIQQDFVSSAVLEEKRKLRSSWAQAIESASAELASAKTTEERKAALRSETAQLARQIEAIDAELEDLQPLSAVVNRPAIQSVLREITEAVLADAVATRPQYKSIKVDALMARFDTAYESLVAAIAKA